MQEFLQLATELADASGEIIKKYFRTPFDIEQKGDSSPVTIADRSVEQRLREILEERRPQDGIIGEEFGIKQSQSGLSWVLDPIDGTKSFMIGRPTFGTLIGLWEGEDKPILGVIDQAISAERWIGLSGEQTTFNGKAVHTRPCAGLKDAIISSTTPSMFDASGHVYERFYEGKMAHGLIWGGDCYMYGLLSSGYLDMTIEASLSTYDYAALVPVVLGAGGYIGDFQGEPLTLSSKGEVIALGDQKLIGDVLKKLA